MTGQDTPGAAKAAEKFVVRLPPGMRRRIADAARCYRRSMNSEIVARLEQSLDSGVAPFPVPEADSARADAAAAVADGPVAEGASAPGAIAESELEQNLLEIFRSLPPERRRALLALFD